MYRGTILALTLLAFLNTATAGPAETLCENLLAAPKGCDLNRAFAVLWLNRDLPTANQQLRDLYDAFLEDQPGMTPAIANAQAKWQMRTWVRIYYLFNDSSAWFPGRLEVATQARIESLFWNYASAKSTIERARPEYVWLLQGSENHDMMDLGNAFLAAQALSKRPGYAERLLPDGYTPAEHAAAWTTYFSRYCEERVKHGLFVEVASPTYGKYLVPELVNIFDFADGHELRRKAEVLLHITWADWAIEQIDGVRGGAKARCYQGNYSRNGASDSWLLMGQVLLESGAWADAVRYNHPILGYGPILATSQYRLPDLVKRLALDPGARGEYVYISRRPGRMTAPERLPSVGGHPTWYFMDAQDSRLVKYTWCTPDHIMGCFFVDPSLKESTQVTPWNRQSCLFCSGNPEDAQTNYATISGQNRWQGITFRTGPEARIFPQCLGRPDKNKPDLTITEIQQVAVQHKNVMIVQANRTYPRNTVMRVYFGPGMRERLVEDGGWLFLEEGNAYAAVKPIARDGGPAELTWDDNHFLRLADTYAPIVFVTGRRAHHPTLEAFQEYVCGHTSEVVDGVMRYRFEGEEDREVELALHLNEPRLPEINGTAINLAPARVYDSPFMRSEMGSGVVEVLLEGERVILEAGATTTAP